MSVLEKLPLDVSWKVSVHSLTGSFLHTHVAIVAPSTDGKTHTHAYGAMADLAKDYDESSDVNSIAAAMYDVFDFRNEPVQVIEYASGGNAVGNVKSNGGSVSETPGGIVKDVEDNLDVMNRYIVPTKDVPEKDVEALSDALFNDRGGTIVYQTASKDDMHAFASHNTQSQKGSDGNVYGVFEDRNLKPGAQVAAKLAVNVPMDAIKVGDLSQFEYTDLNADDVRDVLDSGFNVVENKADMAMMATGKAVNGTFIDNFVDIKYIVDAMTYVAQRYMNAHNMPYNAKSIAGITSAVQSEGNQLAAIGVFMSKPKVTAPTIATVSNGDMESRVYKGMNVSGDLFHSIEKFQGHIDITE